MNAVRSPLCRRRRPTEAASFANDRKSSARASRNAATMSSWEYESTLSAANTTAPPFIASISRFIHSKSSRA